MGLPSFPPATIGDRHGANKILHPLRKGTLSKTVDVRRFRKFHVKEDTLSFKKQEKESRGTEGFHL